MIKRVKEKVGKSKTVNVDKLTEKLNKAEETLKDVLDLINSNEDLAHFYSAKKEIRKPIEDYFKKAKK